MTKIRHGQFGYHAYHRHLPAERRLANPCANCPFVVDFGLTDERMEGIKFSLSMGQPFWCHKTVYQPKVRVADDADGHPSYHPAYRMCRGAELWLEETMAKDGRDELAALLGVTGDTVRRWLKDGRLPGYISDELERWKQPYFVGRKADGTIDLVLRCHRPQTAVLIHPQHGPDKVISFDATSERRLRGVMLDVRWKIAPQWQLR